MGAEEDICAAMIQQINSMLQEEKIFPCKGICSWIKTYFFLDVYGKCSRRVTFRGLRHCAEAYY